MIYRWWHKYIRRRTKPIPADVAVLWKRRLSIAYAVLAWNAFGILVYSIYQGKADWAHYYGLKSDEEHSMPPGRAWANTLGIKNAKVVRISGFTKVDEYDIVDGEEVRNKQNETKDEGLTWNAFGILVYSIYQGKADWAHYYGLKSDEEHSMPPGRAWANTLGIKNAKVVRISGFTKVDEYDIYDFSRILSLYHIVDAWKLLIDQFQ